MLHAISTLLQARPATAEAPWLKAETLTGGKREIHFVTTVSAQALGIKLVQPSINLQRKAFLNLLEARWHRGELYQARITTAHSMKLSLAVKLGRGIQIEAITSGDATARGEKSSKRIQPEGGKRVGQNADHYHITLSAKLDENKWQQLKSALVQNHPAVFIDETG